MKAVGVQGSGPVASVWLSSLQLYKPIQLTPGTSAIAPDHLGISLSSLLEPTEQIEHHTQHPKLQSSIFNFELFFCDSSNLKFLD